MIHVTVESPTTYSLGFVPAAVDSVPFPAPRWPTLPMREIPYTTFSDYSGSLVDRANLEAILEDWAPTNGEDEPIECEPPVRLTGDHGTRALVWPAWCPLTRNLAEIVERLEKYPVLDEERWSNLEYQVAQEEWDGWARRDVERDLEAWTARIGSSDAHDAIQDLTEGDWWDLVAAAEDGGNPLWQAEGTSVTWDTDEMAKRLIATFEGTRPLKYAGLTSIIVCDRFAAFYRAATEPAR